MSTHTCTHIHTQAPTHRSSTSYKEDIFLFHFLIGSLWHPDLILILTLLLYLHVLLNLCTCATKQTQIVFTLKRQTLFVTQDVYLPLSLPVVVGEQRTRRGWFWSTTTRSSPPSGPPHRGGRITPPSTTPPKRSSWPPSSANQSTVSRNCPTTAGSPASSTHRVRPVDGMMLI